MSFWNPLNASKDTSNISWKHLTDVSQLDEIIQSSYDKPVAIFKHSIRCGISAMVLDHLEGQWDIDAKNLDVYFLDLINYRPVSNETALKLGVPHQSPQIILLKEGKAVYATSHHAISAQTLKEVLA